MDTASIVIEDDDDIGIVDSAKGDDIQDTDQTQLVDSDDTENSCQTQNVFHFVDLIDNKSGSDPNESSENDAHITDSNEDEDNSSNHMSSKDNDMNLNENDDYEDRDKHFVMLLRNNNLLNIIIQKCLKIDKQMSYVINKTLLPLYRNADIDFKKSGNCLEVLNRILGNLRRDPHYKFSHIKSLCEVLKDNRRKRNINLPEDVSDTDIHIATRQSKRIQEKRRQKRKRIENRKAVRYKKHNLTKSLKAKSQCNANEKTDIIHLDQSDEEVSNIVSLIDIDDSNGENEDIVILEDTSHGYRSLEQTNNESNNTDKDVNLAVKNLAVDRLLSQNHIEKETNVVFSQGKVKSTIIDIQCDNLNGCDEADGELLNNVNASQNRCTANNEETQIREIPIDTQSCVNETHNIENTSNIVAEVDLLDESVGSQVPTRDLKEPAAIEKCIEYYKNLVDKLEQQEVTTNSQESPYVKCDRYKAKIVELYRKLCKITGNGDGNLMKPREIRLKVTKGRHPGPIKSLERHLNNSIDANGCILLPDFQDVLTCVKMSNIAEKLGWSKQEIINEAILLFSQCGHALRRIRQKREYKDLMRYVRDKAIDDNDPATEDPQLLARLEENKCIGRAKENEIYDKYANMQYMNGSHVTGQNNFVRIEQENSDSDSELDTPAKKRKSEANNQVPTNPIIKDTTSNITTPHPVISQNTSSIGMTYVNKNKITSNSELRSFSGIDSNVRRYVPVFTILPTIANSYSLQKPINSDTNMPENIKNNLINTNEVEDNHSKTEVVENSLNKRFETNCGSKENHIDTYNDNIAIGNMTRQNTIDIQNNMFEIGTIGSNLLQRGIVENSLNNCVKNNISTLPNYRFAQTSKENLSCMQKNPIETQIIKNNFCQSDEKYGASSENNNSTTENLIHCTVHKDIQIKEEQTDKHTLNEIHELKVVPILNANEPQSSNEENQLKEEPVDIQYNSANESSEANAPNATTFHNNYNAPEVQQTQIKDTSVNNKYDNNTIDHLNNFDLSKINEVTVNVEDNRIEGKVKSTIIDIQCDNLNGCIEEDGEHLNNLNAPQKYYCTASNKETQVKEMPNDTQICVNETSIIENNLNVNSIGNVQDRPKIRVKSLEELKYNANETRVLNPNLTLNDENCMKNDVVVESSVNVTVKSESNEIREPQDIRRLLEGLGDNYISTIFDIEDPFLVVDVSSDSSLDDL